MSKAITVELTDGDAFQITTLFNGKMFANKHLLLITYIFIQLIHRQCLLYPSRTPALSVLRATHFLLSRRTETISLTPDATLPDLLVVSSTVQNLSTRVKSCHLVYPHDPPTKLGCQAPRVGIKEVDSYLGAPKGLSKNSVISDCFLLSRSSFAD